MFGGLLKNALDHIDVVELAIDSQDVFARSRAAEEQINFRLYAVSSCVTRLYAIYEHFVESLISDYLDSLPELVAYDALPEGLKHEYRFGISYILGKIDSERYSHLKHEHVIQWYHDALFNSPEYRFVPEALTRHDQNLRLNVVVNLLGRLGLSTFPSWVTKSEDLVALYEEKTAIFEQLSAEIRSFVQTRNDSAHGLLEDVQGRELLLRHCSVVRALVTSLAAYVGRSLLQRQEEAGRILVLGRVTEVFARPGAFIATMAQGRKVSRGDVLYFVSAGYCLELNAENLQLHGADVDEALADTGEVEVGIKCARLPKRHSLILSSKAG